MGSVKVRLETHEFGVTFTVRVRPEGKHTTGDDGTVGTPCNSTDTVIVLTDTVVLIICTITVLIPFTAWHRVNLVYSKHSSDN